MAVSQELLDEIRERNSLTGVLTRDRYFSAIQDCFAECEGGFCPTKLFEKASETKWKRALKQASKELTFTHDDMDVSEFVKAASDLSAPGSIMDFTAVVTSCNRDRDKDFLDTKGATLDPKSPLLWQHIPIQPIGRLVKELDNNGKRLVAKFAIADTELGRDAAALIEMGALRISHGFDPSDYEPNDDDEGYTFRKFLIYEVSVVSIPANVDAVITAYSRKSLKSQLIGGWAKKFYDARPVVVAVPELAKPEEPVETKAHECSCHTKSASAPVEKSELLKAYEALGELLTKNSPVTDIDGDYQEDGENVGVDDTPRIYRCPECGYSAEVGRFNYMTNPPATPLPQPSPIENSTNPQEKAMSANTKGRMSKENVEHLKSAHGDVEHLHGMADLPRDHKALCKSAMSSLKTVIPGMGSTEGEDSEEDVMAPEEIGVALKALSDQASKCVKEAYDDMDTLKGSTKNRVHKAMAASAMDSMCKVMPMPGSTNRPVTAPINGTDTVGSGYEQPTDKGFRTVLAQIKTAAKDLPVSDLRSLACVLTSMAEVKEEVA